MLEVLQVAGSLGGGVFLGLIVFLMYRRDRQTTEQMWKESKEDAEKMWREGKKFTEDRLTKLLEEDHETRKENTKMLTELATLVKRLNGKT